MKKAWIAVNILLSAVLCLLICWSRDLRGETALQVEIKNPTQPSTEKYIEHLLPSTEMQEKEESTNATDAMNTSENIEIGELEIETDTTEPAERLPEKQEEQKKPQEQEDPPNETENKAGSADEPTIETTNENKESTDNLWDGGAF